MCLTQVGHGLSREDKALKLAFEHWIEAVSTISTNPLIVFLRFSDVLNYMWVKKGHLPISLDKFNFLHVNTNQYFS